MWLILDDPAQPPKTVLGTGIANDVTLDMGTKHHDLPDAWVRHASNCCGLGESVYQFDGNEYRLVSSHSGQGLSQLDADASPGIPGVALKDGCELTERAMPSLLNDTYQCREKSSVGLRLVTLNCDQTQTTTVWLIRRTCSNEASTVQVSGERAASECPRKRNFRGCWTTM